MEYDPLLPPGLHDIHESELGSRFSDGFVNSATRPKLLLGLRQYLDALKRVGVPFEIWVDGSFSTNKDNPSDVDLVVFAEANQINSLDQNKQKILGWLLDRTTVKVQFGCDVLFAPTENTELRSYWRGWYGFDRLERPKGIGRLTVLP